MGVALRKKSALGLLPYIIEPRAIDGKARSVAIIKCDHKDCTHTAETSAAGVSRNLPLEAINKKFTMDGWFVKRHHNKCPEHNGTIRAKERKVLTLATIPKRFEQQTIVDEPDVAVADVPPVRSTIPSLSHVHESKVGDLTVAQQLVWYKQALDREKRKTDRAKTDARDLAVAIRPITNLARNQFDGSGVVRADEVGWADNRTVSFNINFALLKNAVRAVEGN